MSEADFETVTYRVPAHLKVAFQTYADSRGMTLTAAIRDAMETFLAPRGRIYQAPGLSTAFDDFMRERRGASAVTLLVVSDRTGERLYFEGQPVLESLSPTLAAVQRKERLTKAPWIILRKEIVAWHEQSDKLALSLNQQGWVNVENTRV